jgi:intraflagellar transport protein 172
MKAECAKQGLGNVMAKLTSCLLRYTKEIRADKAYFDAGTSCRNVGLNDSAYLYFNRYIDLYDAIDDPDNAGTIDNQEFEHTDIPSPFEIPLPEKNIISPEERDQIRDWVLEINMDGSVGQSLPNRRCEHCGTDIYECALNCSNCNS